MGACGNMAPSFCIVDKEDVKPIISELRVHISVRKFESKGWEISLEQIWLGVSNYKLSVVCCSDFALLNPRK